MKDRSKEDFCQRHGTDGRTNEWASERASERGREERGGRECPREIPRVDLSSTLSSASVRLSVASSRVVRPPLALALHGCQMPTAFALSFAEWCPFEEGTAQDAEKGRGRADKHLSALSDLFSLALSLSLSLSPLPRLPCFRPHSLPPPATGTFSISSTRLLTLPSSFSDGVLSVSCITSWLCLSIHENDSFSPAP